MKTGTAEPTSPPKVTEALAVTTIVAGVTADVVALSVKKSDDVLAAAAVAAATTNGGAT